MPLRRLAAVLGLALVQCTGSNGGSSDAAMPLSDASVGADQSPSETGNAADTTDTVSFNDASARADAADATAPSDVSRTTDATSEASASDTSAMDAGAADGDAAAGLDANDTVPTDAGDGGNDGDAPSFVGMVPCTQAGQTNCVPCDGSDGGVCTPTEALFMQIDLNAGLDPNYNQPYVCDACNDCSPVAGTPPSSCYACMTMTACLPLVTRRRGGHDCSQVPPADGGSADAAASECLTALACMLATGCGANPAGIGFCYCGLGGGETVSCASQGALANGPCFLQEAAGFPYVATDASDVLLNYTDPTLPSGAANDIIDCLVENCPQCYAE